MYSCRLTPLTMQQGQRFPMLKDKKESWEIAFHYDSMSSSPLPGKPSENDKNVTTWGKTTNEETSIKENSVRKVNLLFERRLCPPHAVPKSVRQTPQSRMQLPLS